MTNQGSESEMRTALTPPRDDLPAVASKMVSDAHRAMLAHDAHIQRLRESVNALEETLAHKRAALETARQDRDSFRDMVRETFDFYRSVAERQ